MNTKMQKIGNYMFMHLSFVVYSFVSVLSKTASKQGLFTPSFFGITLLVICLLAVYALLWQQVLKHFPLIKAYSNKSVVIMWNLVWAFLFFGEIITLENLIGSAIILAGIILVSSDDD
jgi:drug/metabolite transporter (DMT)-like permease